MKVLMSNAPRSTSPIASPLEGEADARTAAGGGYSSHAANPQFTPLPSPPPQGGREQTERAEGKNKQQFRRVKHDIHGWVILDKPVGMTSTQAVGAIKRLFQCKRAGHAGTL